MGLSGAVIWRFEFIRGVLYVIWRMNLSGEDQSTRKEVRLFAIVQ